jgi:hypothetical protein
MNELVCTGLDGSDPVTALAAMGLLGIIERSDSHVTMGWSRGSQWHPVYWTDIDAHGVVEAVVERMVGSDAALARTAFESDLGVFARLVQEGEELANLSDGCTDKTENTAVRLEV